MFEFTSAKIDIIASVLHENGSPAKWKTEVYSWSSCQCALEDGLIVCAMLPRLPSESELVPLKMKRKLSYKGYYLYDYVCPERLNSALKRLKVNNPLYADIEIDGNWVASAIPDDKDLVMSMLKQPECMSEGSNDPEPMDASTSNDCNPEPTNSSSNTPT